MVHEEEGGSFFNHYGEGGEDMQSQIILQNKGENPYTIRVESIASHLTVSNAFMKSMLRQHLLRILFLPNKVFN